LSAWLLMRRFQATMLATIGQRQTERLLQ
jgi:hypothetical protein